MRYVEVETLVFTTAENKDVEVKGMRDIPVQNIGLVVTRLENEKLDAVAARDDVYGQGGETNTYRIFDAMAADICDRRFDDSNLRLVKVPV